jgi:hypothetical protein
VQRLRFHGKPLVQIAYLPEKNALVALCVMKEAKPDHAVAAQSVDEMGVVTWRRGQLGYALIGRTDGVDLATLDKRISEGYSELLF